MDDATFTMHDTPPLPTPDMTVLRLNRRPPPGLPLDVFGPFWARFIREAAEAAAAPADYVAACLLSATSCLIGNSRWPQAWPGWEEPSHLWNCAVGDSGGGKSPAADTFMRAVLPEIERRMNADYPDAHAEWKVKSETQKARVEQWEKDVRAAQKQGKGAPPPPHPGAEPPEPQAPRLRQVDVTIERVATLLATSAPKGLFVTRDELAGWFLSMTQYNDSGRQFWLEAYGGRYFRVERVKHPAPIEVQHLVVSLYGGTQPDKLAEMVKGADDGFLARICWYWPDPVAFARPKVVPGIPAAIEALDRLRLLAMAPGAPPVSDDDCSGRMFVGAAKPEPPAVPVLVPLAAKAQMLMVNFARDMEARKAESGGLMISALGKARGLALRLSLVLQYLWWCGEPGYAAPPSEISAEAFMAAAMLVDTYLMPMAERVYGDAATRSEDKNAATLARWIFKTRPEAVNTRKLQRETRLPGLDTTDTIRAAIALLIEAGWLFEPAREGRTGRPKGTFLVNPAVYEATA